MDALVTTLALIGGVGVMVAGMRALRRALALGRKARAWWRWCRTANGGFRWQLG